MSVLFSDLSPSLSAWNKPVMNSWVPSSMNQCSVCHFCQEFKGFFLMRKTKWQTRRKYPSLYKSNTWAHKVVDCSVPECHTVLTHVLLEQLHLVLVKPFQQLDFHNCQNDWVDWTPSKAHSFPSNLDCLRPSVSETKIFPSNICYRNWWKHPWTWLKLDKNMICCKFILPALDHKCQVQSY